MILRRCAGIFAGAYLGLAFVAYELREALAGEVAALQAKHQAEQTLLACQFPPWKQRKP